MLHQPREPSKRGHNGMHTICGGTSTTGVPRPCNSRDVRQLNTLRRERHFWLREAALVRFGPEVDSAGPLCSAGASAASARGTDKGGTCASWLATCGFDSHSQILVRECIVVVARIPACQLSEPARIAAQIERPSKLHLHVASL